MSAAKAYMTFVLAFVGLTSIIVRLPFIIILYIVLTHYVQRLTGATLYLVARIITG